MSKRLLYRVENSEGQGPWSCGATHRASRVSYEEGSIDPNDHPAPYNDEKLRGAAIDGRLFSFPTLAEYRRWFSTPAQRKALAVKGDKSYENCDVMLVAYEIDEDRCTIGARQALFHKSDAREVWRWECDEVETNPVGFQ